ncbi:hypothetical protein COMA2_110107 [Candidatus Nitrospira nitrificans]|uniref:Uncharacterized protein n=1 Tax=Candidatus Nitrospira nitrificans TaxID=1742973 RepID=A0A0S4L540_9BACT|nr:hypothetical protein COMA2_110107 [Candidatus Nitrospira nitrificans]
MKPRDVRSGLHEPLLHRDALSFRDDVSVGFFDAVDRMDLGDDDVGQRSFILDADKEKNIRTAETGMGLFDSGHALQRGDDILGFARFDLDENVGSRCHVTLPALSV